MNTVKKYMICLLVVALGITIIPAGFQNAEAAKKAETAKKTAPARVKGLKAEVHEIAGSGGREIRFSWKRAARAGKYEVFVKAPYKELKLKTTVRLTQKNKKKYANNNKYMLIKAGKKYRVYAISRPWKKIAVTKKVRYSGKINGKKFKKIFKKDGRYLVRVRGIKGKKKGKFSAVKKLMLKGTGSKTGEQTETKEDGGIPANKVGTYVGITEYTGSEKNDTFFTNSQSIKDEKGVSTYVIIISTDGGKKWLAGNYDFVVTNVTPNAYKKVFSQLGCSDSIKVTKSIKEDCVYNYYEKKFKDVTRLTLKVQMGPAVKVGKFYEKHGKYLSGHDSLFPGYYLIPSEDDGNNYYKYDRDLFKRMRGIIEAKLWTSDMTTADKLRAVSDYINRTTHYPGESISKENNPTLWKDWSVEGKELLYYLADRPLLNGMMKFQGGITTCQASQQLGRVAGEDLGLDYIYDSEKDEVLDKEGYWRGIGKYSSAPYNPWHETLWYKDKDLKVYGYDTQGRTYYDEECDCAVHKCREKVIPLN